MSFLCALSSYLPTMQNTIVFLRLLVLCWGSAMVFLLVFTCAPTAQKVACEWGFAVSPEWFRAVTMVLVVITVLQTPMLLVYMAWTCIHGFLEAQDRWDVLRCVTLIGIASCGCATKPYELLVFTIAGSGENRFSCVV